ncbi:MAG: type II toxin-antitoxin system RelE/ParE family toxin [Candidatus Omnitrophota bacterium]|nr:type II toxin-antitoxin system RelE/ParE family toxin [Candidatus Omnitrophota bacterium]
MKDVICSYLTINGRSPVKAFINSLDRRTQLKFYNARDLLEQFGRRLTEPHAKQIEKNLFELRFIGIEGKIRVLYFFFHHNEAIFINGFVKKTQKAPKREITTALKRRKMFLNNQ